jgi:hypothetical protein
VKTLFMVAGGTRETTATSQEHGTTKTRHHVPPLGTPGEQTHTAQRLVAAAGIITPRMSAQPTQTVRGTIVEGGVIKRDAGITLQTRPARISQSACGMTAILGGVLRKTAGITLTMRAVQRILRALGTVSGCSQASARIQCVVTTQTTLPVTQRLVASGIAALPRVTGRVAGIIITPLDAAM